MTTQTPAKKTFLQQLGTALTGNSSDTAKSPNLRAQPQALEVSVVPPFSPPPVFIDYAAEGDEPADLALIALIPPGLANFNLSPTPEPHQSPAAAPEPSTPEPSAPEPSEIAEAVAPSCLINACSLTDRPRLEQAADEAELTNLTPLSLSRLNIAPQIASPIASPVAPITPQIASSSTALLEPTHQPLPDLSTLSRANITATELKSAEPKTNTETVCIPTTYLDQLNQIVEELITQQQRQMRHNEQLGALVKQLLSRIAQQQTELNRAEQANYSQVQHVLQSCLSDRTESEWPEFETYSTMD